MTIEELQNKKKQGRKITLLTAYDYPSANFIDKAGIDIILVGDSLAMSVLGHKDTTLVTMDEMVHHARAARVGVTNALLVGDMPLSGSSGSVDDAVKNAARFVSEAGCRAVKFEGAQGETLQKIKAAIAMGIPVMGHVGLTPQTAVSFKVQGKDAASGRKILDDARLLENAGCFSIILECIPDELAKLVTEKLNIPTIGIGAGIWCDGQALVTNDMLGLFEKFTPKFVKKYVNLSQNMLDAFRAYKEEVENLKFPDREHSFTMNKEELRNLSS